MNSTLKTFKTPSPTRTAGYTFLATAMLAFALALAMSGCAGSKKSSSSYAGLDSSSSEPTVNPSQQKVDEARKSAEEAEQKAHELRTQKAAGKSGN